MPALLQCFQQDPAFCIHIIVELRQSRYPRPRIRLESPKMGEMSNAIRKLPNGRAVGSDGIPGELLRAAISSTAQKQLRSLLFGRKRVPGERK